MSMDNLHNFKDQGPAVGSAVAPSKIGEAALAFEVLEALPRRGGWTLHLFAPVLSRALPKYITHVTLKKVLPVSLSLIKIDSPMFISWMYLMNAFEMKQLHPGTIHCPMAPCLSLQLLGSQPPFHCRSLICC